MLNATYVVTVTLSCGVRYFDSIGWRLIDFGLSMKVRSSEIQVWHDSTRYRHGGRRFRNASDRSMFQWGVKDDMEMLIAFILKTIE